MSEPGNITEILEGFGHDDPEAEAKLVAAVHDELHRMARQKMTHERPDHTLQATALVNEAYLRLFREDDVHFDNRAHFFCAAAEAMRRILIERARHHGSLKRGGDWQRITLGGLEGDDLEPFDERIVALDEALRHLEEVNPIRSEVVKLRFFAGLTVGQTADVLRISPATVERHWTTARAWLVARVLQDESRET